MYSVGTKLRLFITHIKAESVWLKIWAQLDASNAEYVEEELQKLEPILEGVNGQSTLTPHPGDLNVGDICCAKFIEDDKWYRAKIIDLSVVLSNKVGVKFIDYGNIEFVAVSDIRKLDNPIFTLPALASEFLLADVVSIGTSWSDEALVVLKESLNYQEVAGIVVCIDGPVPKIRVSNTNLEIDCLSEYLIQNNFALAITNKLDFTMPILQIGKDYTSYVIQVNSLSKFWIQIAESENQLEQIRSEIDLYVDSNSKHIVDYIQNGLPCIAQFSDDGLYYRAKVVNICEDGFLVHFVDYGNSELKQASELWTIPPSLLAFAAQAIECCLFGAERFLELPDAASQFISLTENKELNCKVLSKLADGKYVIDIEENNTKIIDYIIFEKLQPFPERIKYSLLETLPGNAYEVVVSHIKSVNKFYCQLSKNLKNLGILMKQLQSHMNSCCKTISQAELERNMPCSVKCPIEKKWYRGKIIELQYNTALINYVDYGKETSVDIMDIKELDESIVDSLPAQAIQCNLVGVGNGHSDQIEEFYNLTRSKMLIMKVHCVKENVFVDLYDMNVIPHIHINDILQTRVKTKENSTISQVQISTPELRDVEEVFITSVLSSGRFFAQLCKFSLENLDLFLKRLNTHYSNIPKNSNLLYADKASHLGEYCCTVFSEDSTFYRGRVTSESNNMAEILFVDYGNSETKALNEIQKIHEEFASFPKQGIICRLSSEYANLSEEELKEILTDATIEVKILKCIEKEYIVSLTDSESNISIKEKLKLPLAQSPVDTHLKPSIRRTYSKPGVGDKENVIITHLVNPNEIWCQLQRSAAALLSLMDEIHSLAVSDDKHIEEPRLGMPCVAQYADDGWYRALITNINNGCIEVKFVDFGNSEVVKLSTVKPIPDYCLSLPRQCIKCTLNGIPIRDKWDPSVIKELENMLLEKNLYASFTAVSSDPELYSLSLDDMFQKNLNEIIFKKFAPALQSSSAFEDNGWEENISTNENNSSEIKQMNQPSIKFGGNEIVMNNQWKNTEPEQERQFGSSNSRSFGFSNRSPKGEKNFQPKSSIDYKSSKNFGDFPRKFNKPDFDRDRSFSAKNKDFAKPRNHSSSDTENNNMILPETNKRFSRKFTTTGSEESIDASSDSTENSVNTMRQRNNNNDRMKEGFGRKFLPNNNNNNNNERGFRNYTDSKEHTKLDGSGDPGEVWNSFPSNNQLQTNIGVQKKKTFHETNSSLPKDTSKKITFDHLHVQVGHFKDVTIVYVVSPSEFYCHLVEEAGNLKTLMNNLSDSYDSITGNELRLSSLQPFTPCCAKYSEDNSWYRAKILTNLGSQVEVLFVDYGNTDILPIENVKELKSEFLQLPAQALKCQLDNARPVGESWMPQNVNEFQKLTLEKCFVAQIMSISPTGALLVNLIDVGVNDVSINHKFIKSGHGKFTKALDNLAVSEGLATYISPIISKGTKEAVQVSWITNFSEFFCNILKTKPDLDSLMEKMQHFYHGTQCSGLIINNWCVGNPCVAKFSEDGVWYRAMMKEILGDSVRVEYVDFGNSEILPKYKIHPMVPEFMMLPVQAVKCRLNGIQHSNDTWVSLPLQTFEKYLTNKAVCHFLGHSRDIYIVDWIINDKNIVADIIKDGLGLPDERPLEEILTECKKIVSDQLSVNLILAQHSPFPAINLDWQESEYKDIIVCDGGNPNCFWCYLASDTDKIKKLSDSISIRYENIMGNEMKLTNPKQGTACAVKLSQDNKWHRGIVLDRLSPSKLMVFLVDTGLQEEINITQAKILDTEYLQIPQSVFQCQLSGFPKDLNPEDFSEQFMNLTKEKELVLQFVEQKNNWVDVNLYDISNGLERKIIDLILDKEHQKKEGKSLELKKFPPINLSWNIGEKKKITVSGISFPEKFWCQLVDSAESIQNITARLLSFYSEIQDNSYQLTQPSPGTVCVVKSQNSDVWNRAIIQKILSPSKLQVFYVDIGRDDDVQLTMAKVITDEFIQIPVQAFPCCLKGYENIVDTTDLYRQFDGIVSNTELIADLESIQDNIFEVSLYMTTSNEPINVLNELIGCRAAVSPDSVTAAEIEWNVGEEKEITITGLGLPDQFWCQLLSSVENFTKFTNELSEKYDNLVEKELELTIPVVGSPCVAWSSESQKWYRAIIQSQMSDMQVLVSFIDTGNWEKVLLGKVKAITPELLQHPSESFKCRLAGLPSHAEVTKMGYYFFDVIYEKKYFIAKLDAKTDTFYEIILYYESQEKRYNVNEYVLARYKGESYPSPKASPHPIANHFKPAQVSLGKHDGFVSHVNSAKDFYVHLTAIEDELHYMSENLNDFFAKVSETEMVPTNLQVGHICCALYSHDDIWYRSQVTMISCDDISVRFVDYGNVDVVKLNKVKILPLEYLAYPILAIRCTLSTDSDKELENFHKYVLDKDLVVEFLSTEEPCEVVLFDAESGLSVTEIADADRVTEIPEIKDENSLNIESEVQNKIDSEANLANQALSMEISSDLKLSSNHSTTSDSLAFIYQDLTGGKNFEVTVSHVVSPSQFWLQIINQKHHLDELFEKLNITVDSNEASDDVEEICSEMPCAALYTEDETWYRGKVLAVEQDDVHVHFVDYGNSDTVKARNVRRLKPDEIQIPVMALECELHNVTSTEDDWTVDAIEEFETLVLEKTLLAKIVSQTKGKYSVHLLNMGQGVANVLAERGFTELVNAEVNEIPNVEAVEDKLASDDLQMEESEKSQLLETSEDAALKVSEGAALLVDMSDEFLKACFNGEMLQLSSDSLNDYRSELMRLQELDLIKRLKEIKAQYDETTSNEQRVLNEANKLFDRDMPNPFSGENPRMKPSDDFPETDYNEESCLARRSERIRSSLLNEYLAGNIVTDFNVPNSVFNRTYDSSESIEAKLKELLHEEEPTEVHMDGPYPIDPLEAEILANFPDGGEPVPMPVPQPGPGEILDVPDGIFQMGRYLQMTAQAPWPSLSESDEGMSRFDRTTGGVETYSVVTKSDDKADSSDEETFDKSQAISE